MKPNEQPIHSAKLVAIAGQIKQLLLDNDIAGIVILHDDAPAEGMVGYIENIIHLSPTYSCAIMEDSKFRVKPPLVDPAMPGSDKKIIAGTINMLANIRFKMSQIVQALAVAEQVTRQKFGIKPPKQGNGNIIQMPPGGKMPPKMN